MSQSKLNFKALYLEHLPYVKTQIFYIVGEEHVEDLSQEVFFKIYKNLSRFRAESSVKTWVYKITLTTCYDFLRKKKRRSFFNLKPSHPSPSSTAFSESETLKMEIEKSVQNMSTKLQSVFVLYHFSQLNLREIAETLNLPLGTVKSRLKKAKNEVIKALGLKENNL